MKHRFIVVALTGAASLMACQITTAGMQAQGLVTADIAELRQIEVLLLDPTAHERSGAARALANIASRYAETPEEVRALLAQAAGDIDPEITFISSHALSLIEAREQADPDLQDVSAEENPDRNEIDRISALLADPTHHEHPGAGLQLVNLASGYRTPHPEIRSLLELALDDADPEVAEPVARFLAQVDGLQQGGTAPVRLSEEAMEDFEWALATLQDPASHEHWLALAKLRDMPLPAKERQIRVKALQSALLVDDPLVRNYAAFALEAVVAGSTDALRQMHVGLANSGNSGSGFQPQPGIESGTAIAEPGYFTKAGVFVGTSGRSEDPQWLQPFSDARPDRQHTGYVDAHGVFIGAIASTPSGGDRQQPPP